MKVIDREKKIENDSRIHEEVKERLIFHYSRTNFWISLLFMILESIIPSLILYLLTSPDAKFRIHTYDAGTAVGFCVALLAGVLLITTITFILHWHQYDQIIYNFTIAFIIIGLYITGYWWTWDQILYRCLVALAFLLVGVTIGTMFGLLIRNSLGVWTAKRTKDFSNVGTLEEFKKERDEALKAERDKRRAMRGLAKSPEEKTDSE